MGLTGIQIFKLLPKTNCKECGVPTCLAFAMNLAAGKAELSACPYVSDEAKASLSEASAPPIRPVEIGAGDGAFKTGGELVMFRHEKTFFNPTGLALKISDSDSDEDVDQKIKCFKENQYDRVGVLLKGDLFALKADSGDAAKYAALVKKVRDADDSGLILWSDNPDMIKAGLAERGGSKVLVYGANKGNLDAMIALAKEHGAVLGVVGNGLDEIKELSDACAKAEVKDVIFDTGARTAGDQLRDQTAVRRLALQAKDRSFGFPTIAPVCDMADTPAAEAVIAAAGIAKYAGIIILSSFEGQYLFPLLLERLNIYTDPQRPMKTDEGLYSINDANEKSPVIVTSNFSLTYFLVSGELENSRMPCWLFVVDTDGLSVLTAWAAGKFVGDAIAEAMIKGGCNEKVTNKKVVIPGLAAIVSGDLEEDLGDDWEVMIGPRESSVIPAYLKQNFS